MLFPGHLSPQGRHAGAYDPRSSKSYWFLRIVLALCIIAVLAWPFIEPFILQTEYSSLVAGDLPRTIGQLKIVYVTDIHKGGLYTQGRLTGLINDINAVNADLVLLGGDYADSSHNAIRFFEELPALHSRYGVYAVLGNNDRTLPESNLSALKAAMRASGITPLVNAVQRVDVGGASIYIAGVDDVNNGHPDVASVANQVASSDYVIFLCHSPAVIAEAVQLRDKNGVPGWFDLGLFGHTHGGQVALFGPLLRDDGVDAQYREGWLTRNRAQLLISRGIGTSGVPVRWLCLPQMHVMTLTAPRN